MGKIAWCVTPPSKGSGGFRTICSKITVLQRRHHDNFVFIAPDSACLDDAGLVAEHMSEWFGCVPSGVFLEEEIPAGFDAVIATAWDTAAFAARQKSRCKLYFVQDYEPWFFPLNYERIKAEKSFDLGLKPITMGRWLSWKLSKEKGLRSSFCDFGANLSIYRPMPAEKEYAICAIYQPEKDRRISRMLEEAISILLAADSSVKVYLYGSSACFLPLEKRVVNLGLISIEECNDLYNKTLCGISVSGSNPSRIPFEMMAAGLPVVDLYLENNLFDFEDGTVELVDASPEGLASGVLRFLADDDLREERSRLCSLWMSKRDIGTEDERFCDSLELCFSGAGNSSSVPGIKYKKKKQNILPIVEGIVEQKTYRSIHDSVLSKTRTTFTFFRASLSGQPFSPNEAQKFRLATWVSPDQSDIQWFSAALDGNSLRIDVDFGPPSKTDELRYFHFYWFEDDESPFLLWGTVQAVKGSGGVAEGKTKIACKRNYALGSLSIDVELSCPQIDERERVTDDEGRVEPAKLSMSKLWRKIRG